MLRAVEMAGEGLARRGTMSAIKMNAQIVLLF